MAENPALKQGLGLAAVVVPVFARRTPVFVCFARPEDVAGFKP
jgi:hypothetical protein